MSKENNKEFMEQQKTAKNNEEEKQILENSRFVITDEELEQVSGGKTPVNGGKEINVARYRF